MQLNLTESWTRLSLGELFIMTGEFLPQTRISH